MITKGTRRSPLLVAVFVILGAGSSAEGEDSRADALAKEAQAEKPRAKITVSQETTFVTGPLREDGYVDYLAALNQAASEGVTPENNAAVLLWRALGPASVPERARERFFRLLGIPPLSEDGDYFVALRELGPSDWESQRKTRDHLTNAVSRPWSKQESPVVAQWVEENEKPLDLVVAAAQRPRYYSPLIAAEESKLLIATLLLAESEVGEVVRALAARAMLRTREGKLDEAWEDLLACHRLGRLVSQGPWLVQRKVGTDASTMACRAEAALVHHGNLTIEQAGKFLSDLRQLPPKPELADKLNVGERFSLLDAVSELAREGPEAAVDLNGIDRHVVALLGRAVAWDEALCVVNQWYDRTVDAVSKPARPDRLAAMASWEDDLWELADQAKQRDPRLGYSVVSSVVVGPSDAIGRRIGQIYVATLMPAVLPSANADDEEAMWLSLSRTALALAAYRADQGAYPERLSQLSPKYLPEVPQDLFGDAPFRYERQGSGYLLYSVGINGKDDGGRDRPEESSYEFPPPDDLVIRASSQAR